MDPGTLIQRRPPDLAIAERVRRVDAARLELTSTLARVHDGMAEALDWRVWVRRHPLATAAVAAGAGFFVASRLLGGGFRRRRRSLPAAAIETAASVAGAAAAAAAPGVGVLLRGVVLSTLLKRLGPVIVERGVALVTDYVNRKMGGRPFDPSGAGGAETFAPDDLD